MSKHLSQAIICLSPKYKNTDFPNGLTLDDKIKVFEDRVKDWQLNVARKCAEIPDSGFAVLHIVTSYFESIAKYREGIIQPGGSEEFFTKGLLEVFPELRKLSKTVQDDIIEKIYEGVRCGLYHGGMTCKNIFISGEIPAPIAYTNNGEQYKLFVHPNRMLDRICSHFDEYIAGLKDPKNTVLRENFERRFDA